MVNPFIAGAAISAGSQLIGGLLNRSAANKQNKLTQQIANQNVQFQNDFAKHGIRWRVEDAKAAGIHPLYALGANTPTYTPVSANFTRPDYSFVGRMGQDVGRGLMQSASAKLRKEQFGIEQARLARRDALQENLISAQTEMYRARAAQLRQRPQPGVGLNGGTTGTNSGSVTSNPYNTNQNAYMAKHILRGTQITRIVPGIYFVGPTAKFKESVEDMGPFPWQAWAGLISRNVRHVAPYPARTGYQWHWNRATNFLYEAPYGATRRTLNQIESRIRKTLQVKGKQITGSHGHIRK